MAVTIREQPKQDWTIGERGEASRLWKVFGTFDAVEVKTLVLSTAPTTWLGLFRNDQNIRITEVGKNGAWQAPVPYTPFDLSGGGTPPTVMSFRTSGGSQRITQSGGRIDPYPGRGATVVSSDDFGGGINWDGKKFSGVEVIAPIFDFEIETQLPASSVNNAYISTLINLTAKTNNAAFRGRAAGEILYVGCQGCQDRGGVYRLNHGFKASQNRTNLSLANGQINGVTLGGWEYVWVNYVQDKNAQGAPILKAHAAYVHTLYEPGNFALLGL